MVSPRVGDIASGEAPLEPGGKTKRFTDDEIVTIKPDARFVSIRCAADVA